MSLWCVLHVFLGWLGGERCWAGLAGLAWGRLACCKVLRRLPPGFSSRRGGP